MSSPSKIAVHSVPDLKNTTDDALPNYLSSLNFAQSHTYTDVRLALGYSAVAIAGALFYLDWTLGWDATKGYTAPAVLAYFALNGAFAYWTYYVEQGAVYAGAREGAQLRIASRTPDKHTPVYEITVRFTTGQTPSPSSPKQQNQQNQKVQGHKDQQLWQETQLRAPFTRWFTADGFFVAKPFQQWLASEIAVIGAADPANVVEEIGRGSGTGNGGAKKQEIRMEKLAGLVGAGRASGAAGVGAQGARNRKKA